MPHCHVWRILLITHNSLFGTFQFSIIISGEKKKEKVQKNRILFVHLQGTWLVVKWCRTMGSFNDKRNRMFQGERGQCMNAIGTMFVLSFGNESRAWMLNSIGELLILQYQLLYVLCWYYLRVETWDTAKLFRGSGQLFEEI